MSRRNRHRLGFCYRLLVVVFKSLMLLLARCDRRGMENIPRDGGFIAVVNHVSYLDGPAYLLAQHDAGKAAADHGQGGELPPSSSSLGRMLRGTGRFIPVYRETGDAALAYREALTAVQRGSALVAFPKGPLTRDPGLWPMTGKTGGRAHRVTTGVPIVPVALWGTHEVLPPIPSGFACSAQDGPGAGRATGGPFRVRGPRADRRGAPGGDRDDHG